MEKFRETAIQISSRTSGAVDVGHVEFGGPNSIYTQEQAAADARNFPVKPIRIIVPFPPGGGNDLMGRFIGAKLTARLGRQTVVDNRPGANGIIGSELAAHSTADGYTLMIVSTSLVRDIDNIGGVEIGSGR